MTYVHWHPAHFPDRLAYLIADPLAFPYYFFKLIIASGHRIRKESAWRSLPCPSSDGMSISHIYKKIQQDFRNCICRDPNLFLLTKVLLFVILLI